MTVTGTREPRPIDLSILTFVEDTSVEERTTHTAQCHCGAVKFTVTLKWPFPKYPVNKCSCSICTHTGYLLVYPARRDVVFTRGKTSTIEIPHVSFLSLSYNGYWLYLDLKSSGSVNVDAIGENGGSGDSETLNPPPEVEKRLIYTVCFALFSLYLTTNMAYPQAMTTLAPTPSTPRPNPTSSASPAERAS